jgi:hypothetical protein
MAPRSKTKQSSTANVRDVHWGTARQSRSRSLASSPVAAQGTRVHSGLDTHAYYGWHRGHLRGKARVRSLFSPCGLLGARAWRGAERHRRESSRVQTDSSNHLRKSLLRFVYSARNALADAHCRRETPRRQRHAHHVGKCVGSAHPRLLAEPNAVRNRTLCVRMEEAVILYHVYSYQKELRGVLGSVEGGCARGLLRFSVLLFFPLSHMRIAWLAKMLLYRTKNRRSIILDPRDHHHHHPPPRHENRSKANAKILTTAGDTNAITAA